MSRVCPFVKGGCGAAGAGEGTRGALRGFKVWSRAALSLCRGLLCSIFQRVVVAILILNHNPFAPSYLSQLGRTLVLRAVEEVVGVLEATGEGEVSLVALAAVVTHFLLVEGEHLRHLRRGVFFCRQGARKAKNDNNNECMRARAVAELELGRPSQAEGEKMGGR